MFKKHPSTILRLNRKVNVTGNATSMKRLPKHIVTTRQQGQHMANRTKKAVATTSRLTENYGRPLSAQTARNRLKAVGLREKGHILAHVSPYLIKIVEEGWLWLDATSEPQGLDVPLSSKDSANYRDEDTKQSFAETLSIPTTTFTGMY